MRRELTIAVTAAVLGALAVAAPAQSDAQAAYKAPRTSWGDPDFEGLWPSTAMVGVPLERPKEYGDRLFLTDAEFKARQDDAKNQGRLDLVNVDVEHPSEEVEAQGMVGGGVSPPPHWLERGEPQRQSSLIVQPKNGQLPPMTAEGTERQKSVKSTYLTDHGFTSYTDLGPYDRCISRGPIATMMPVIYNNGNEFVQAPGFVGFRNEMIHETRVIPLDGRAHVAAPIKSYMGDSRGHWEKDTLVVETSNFNGKTGANANGMLMMMSDALKTTERFTRTGDSTMQYELTVDDPKTWTAPWTVSFELRRDPTYELFEYACHEGNHAMRNMLSAARAADKQASADAAKKR